MYRLLKEILGYGVASGIALVADGGILLLLIRNAGWHYMAASAVSFVCGAFVAYIISVRLAFRFHRIRSKPLELGYFVGLGLVGLTINSAAMFVSVGELGINVLAAKALAACCTFTTNFALRRQLLFRPEATV